MNLKRVFIFAALFMCVASIAFAQTQLQDNILRMAVDNASTALGNPLGTIDTTNNAAIINSVQISQTPYSTWTNVSALPGGTLPGGKNYNTLNYYAQTGFNNGWDGVGLISKGLPTQDTAFNNLDGNSDVGIGLMTIDDYENTIGWGTTFFGANLAPYSPTGVLARYTYLGDTDFDGAITGADVFTVLIAFGANLPGTWVNGSTDYGQSGTIQSYDVFQILIENGLNLPAFNPPAGAGPITPIPEPSTMLLLVIAGSLLLLKRRLSK